MATRAALAAYRNILLLRPRPVSAIPQPLDVPDYIRFGTVVHSAARLWTVRTSSLALALALAHRMRSRPTLSSVPFAVLLSR